MLLFTFYYSLQTEGVFFLIKNMQEILYFEYFPKDILFALMRKKCFEA